MRYEGPGRVQVSGIGLVCPSLSSPLFGQADAEVTMKFAAWRKFVHQAVVGRYTVEAGGAEPDAASNLAQVQVARVREFREKNLLLADEDFAFACSSYDEAVLAGALGRSGPASGWSKIEA